MKLKNQILLGVGIGLVAFIGAACCELIEEKQRQKDIDKFWEEESVKQIMKSAEEDSEELIDSLAGEAESFLKEQQRELDQMMADYFERQQKIMDEWNKKVLN